MPTPPLCPTDALQLVETFLHLSAKARSLGLLSLEEDVDALDAHPFLGPFLRTGLMLVVDGTPSDVVETTLRAYAEAELAAIRQVLDVAIEGTAAIQAEMNPRVMVELLSAHLSPTDKRRLQERR